MRHSIGHRYFSVFSLFPSPFSSLLLFHLHCVYGEEKGDNEEVKAEMKETRGGVGGGSLTSLLCNARWSEMLFTGTRSHVMLHVVVLVAACKHHGPDSALPCTWNSHLSLCKVGIKCYRFWILYLFMLPMVFMPTLPKCK